MSKNTAPGMWPARCSASTSRFCVTGGYEASTTTTSRSCRCSASHSVDLSHRLGGDGAGSGSVRSILFSFQSLTPVSRRSSFVGDFDVQFALEPIRHRQLLLAQKIRIEQLRLVTRAVIGKDRHDGVARAELLGETDGAGDVDAGGTAETKPLVFEQ